MVRPTIAMKKKNKTKGWCKNGSLELAGKKYRISPDIKYFTYKIMGARNHTKSFSKNRVTWSLGPEKKNMVQPSPNLYYLDFLLRFEGCAPGMCSMLSSMCSSFQVTKWLCFWRRTLSRLQAYQVIWCKWLSDYRFGVGCTRFFYLSSKWPSDSVLGEGHCLDSKHTR